MAPLEIWRSFASLHDGAALVFDDTTKTKADPFSACARLLPNSRRFEHTSRNVVNTQAVNISYRAGMLSVGYPTLMGIIISIRGRPQTVE